MRGCIAIGDLEQWSVSIAGTSNNATRLRLATLLANGNVLVAGGGNAIGALTFAELDDHAGGS